MSESRSIPVILQTVADAAARIKVVCSRCQSTTSNNAGRYATHGSYVLGAKKPFKPCPNSGQEVK